MNSPNLRFTNANSWFRVIQRQYQTYLGMYLGSHVFTHTYAHFPERLFLCWSLVSLRYFRYFSSSHSNSLILLSNVYTLQPLQLSLFSFHSCRICQISKYDFHDWTSHSFSIPQTPLSSLQFLWLDFFKLHNLFLHFLIPQTYIKSTILAIGLLQLAQPFRALSWFT